MPDFTVKIFDNVFDEKTHKEIWESMCRPKWNLTGGNKEGGGRFWHMEGLEKEDFYSNFLFTIICEKLLKEKISAFKINRIYPESPSYEEALLGMYDEQTTNY